MYPSLSYWERETFFRNIDVAVIGSHIINLMDAQGLGAVDEFLAACART